MFSSFLPRVIFLLVILVLSHIYLFPIDQKIMSVFENISSWPSTTEKIIQSIESLDAHRLRQLLIFLLISITLLEMKAIVFLSEIVIEGGWVACTLASAVISATLFYCKKIQNISCGECYMLGMICLYVFAFLVSLIHAQDMRRIATLGGPFLLAAGAFVLSSHSNHQGNDISWLIRPVRHSLRLSLRDVLASVGENVAEDEMLQLAMLRWIVDYWTFRPAGNQQTTQNQRQSTTSAAPSTGSATQQNVASSASSGQNERTTQSVHEVQTIGWEDMHSMLTMTTDQMMDEVQQQTTQKVPLEGNANSNTNPHNSASSNTHFDHSNNNESIGNLKSMLESLNEDARAKNAVRSYRQSVEMFPPSRNFAIFVAVVRRCPSFLCLSSWYLDGSWDALPATLILLPFIILEVVRIQDWIKSCQDAFGMDITDEVAAGTGVIEQDNILQLPPGMDAMCILLSSDYYCRYLPSPAIQVWINVQSSVVALESGLTAVQCVHTTVVASELAFNVMSLAKLGAEVIDKGWVHGLGVLACDIFQFHSKAHSDRFTDPRSGQYTSAALSAVQNSQIIARNVSDIMEDEHGQHIVAAIGDVFATVAGRGWLWGKEPDKNNNRSEANAERSEENTGLTERGNVEEENSEPQEELDSNTNETCQLPRDTPEFSLDGTAVSASDLQSTHEMTKKEKETDVVEEMPAHNEFDEPGTAVPGQDKNHAIGDVGNDEESALFELIAKALEQDLISEKEKDAFVEMLLASSNASAENDERAEESHAPKKAEAVAVIKKSLECVFADTHYEELGCGEETKIEMKTENNLSVNQEIVAEDSAQKPLDEPKAVLTSAFVDKNDDGMEPLDGKEIASDLEYEPLEESGSVESNQSSILTDDMEPLDGKEIASDLEYEPLEEPESAESNQASILTDTGNSQDPPTNQVASTRDPSLHATAKCCEDEDDEEQWTLLEEDANDSKSTSRELSLQTSNTRTNSNRQLSIHENKGGGDDWMKWVGGSLAVIGAVVGSVALVNAGNDNQRENEENNARTENQQQRSTVYIEELNDGDD